MSAQLPANTPPTAAFEDFLKSFKSTVVSEADARDALSHLNMDDEDDEVDMADTPGRRTTRSGGGRARARRPRAAAPEPKIKYMVQLQEIANRERDSITIELDDLKEVGYLSVPVPVPGTGLTVCSSRTGMLRTSRCTWSRR